MPKKMVRFAVSDEIFERWERESRGLGISVPEYARLRCLGVLAGAAPVVSSTAQVREPLGPRILAEMQRLGWEKISIPSGVSLLAGNLKANRRAVHGALGSLVAGRKLRRTAYGYFPAGDPGAKRTEEQDVATTGRQH